MKFFNLETENLDLGHLKFCDGNKSETHELPFTPGTIENGLKHKLCCDR